MVRDTIWLLGELVILFFGVTFLVQIFQRRMGADRVRAWMGGRPLMAALKGIAIGFMTPFCTFTAIPMLIGLRQAGVPPAGYVAFVVAAPVLDPVLFGALVLIVGIEAAVVYLAVAFVAAVALAMIAQAIGIERQLKPIDAPNVVLAGAAATGHGGALGSGGSAGSALGSGGSAGSALGSGGSAGSALGSGGSAGSAETTTCGGRSSDAWAGLRMEAPAAAAAAASLLRTMGPLLLLGVALSLIIDATVSPDVTAQLTDFSPRFAIPIAAAIGTPLYVSTGVFVPVADSLKEAGVGIGAIVSLTIAGAGANIPEFVILARLAKPRVIAIFFGYVFGVAVVGGLLAQAIVR